MTTATATADRATLLRVEDAALDALHYAMELAHYLEHEVRSDFTRAERAAHSEACDWTEKAKNHAHEALAWTRQGNADAGRRAVSLSLKYAEHAHEAAGRMRAARA